MVLHSWAADGFIRISSSKCRKTWFIMRILHTSDSTRWYMNAASWESTIKRPRTQSQTHTYTLLISHSCSESNFGRIFRSGWECIWRMTFSRMLREALKMLRRMGEFYWISVSNKMCKLSSYSEAWMLVRMRAVIVWPFLFDTLIILHRNHFEFVSMGFFVISFRPLNLLFNLMLFLWKSSGPFL